MQRFTIRDIENLTGIKAHTLRIWEQRYSFFTPKRKESRHRFYDNEDLKQLLRISFLYHHGWKVSKIAGLSQEAIMNEVRSSPVVAGNYNYYLTRLVESAIDFDEGNFIEILNEITSQIGFEKCIVEVCYPFLLKIGLLWNTNNVIPAQEHFSSCIIQNRIILETEKLAVKGSNQPEILLICPQGEFHELPLLFINYLLRRNGWSTLYLGADIRKDELLQIAGLPHIHSIYLHLITNFTGLTADEYLEELSRAFPGKQILASGEGIKDVQRNFVNVRLLKNDMQINNFISRTTGSEHGS